MNKGIVYAIVAYILWGFFPIFFKLISIVSPLQILAHRFFWSFLFLIMGMFVLRQFQKLRLVISKKVIISYSIAGVVLAINWGTFIFAVNTGHTIEASLGYFINPMVSVLLGVIFLKEKLRVMQWVSVAMAGAGVIYLTAIFGAVPWIALVLAFSFALYGLIKKISPLESLPGLTLETGILFIPAFAFLAFEEVRGVGGFGHTGWFTALMLAASGVVTAIPLLLFAASTRRINLSTIGILQYFTPTLQLLVGIFLFNEYFDIHRLAGFVLIWIGLVIFTIETIHFQRHKPFEISVPQEIVT